MFKKISIIAATVCLVGGATLISTPVAADEAVPTSETAQPTLDTSDHLQISPVSNRVNLKGGQTLDYSFRIQGKPGSSFRIYAAPYSVTNEDYELSFSNQTNYTQLSRWIKFYDAAGNLASEATLTIPNDADSLIVNYSISVPVDVPAGGQYAMIFAESAGNGQSESTGSGIRTISRAGLIVYGSTSGNTIESAEINEYNFNSFLTSGRLTTNAKIHNSGNTDFEVSSTLTVKSIFGRVLYDDTQRHDVLPETDRRISSEWTSTPALGVFNVTYKVSAADATREESKIVIIIPIFVIIIALILLTSLIIWTIILLRKRKERESKVLV